MLLGQKMTTVDLSIPSRILIQSIRRVAELRNAVQGAREISGIVGGRMVRVVDDEGMS